MKFSLNKQKLGYLAFGISWIIGNVLSFKDIPIPEWSPFWCILINIGYTICAIMIIVYYWQNNLKLWKDPFDLVLVITIILNLTINQIIPWLRNGMVPFIHIGH